jgi:hypothetical protein
MLADLVAVNGRTHDPYELLLRARESSITLVVIGGTPRVGQPRLMGRFWHESTGSATWIDRLDVGRSPRQLYLEQDDDLLDGLPLSRAIADLAEAMADLPQLARTVDDAVGVGNAVTSQGTVAFGGGMPAGDTAFRVVPDFEREDLSLAISTLGFALAAQPYAFWVTEPMELDGITVVDDRGHLPALLASTNLPEFVKKELPGLYGETIPIPDSARFLEVADQPVDERVTATTRNLGSLLASFGELDLDDRKRIVEQAIVLLTDNYVHLPLKRAMHAVDPVQRLRLLRQRLDGMTSATMPREIDFHIEITSTLNSLRDLHTGYRLPAPFGTKVAWLPFLIEEIHERSRTRFVLTKWVADAWPEPAMRGATVTHWNGMPIDRAVARNGDRHAGSNEDARHARGLNSLTVRPLGRGLPPDEDWVTLRWLDGGGRAREHTQKWLVFEPGSTVGPGQLVAESSALGLDDQTDDVQQARKILYAPQVATAERRADGQFLATPLSDAASGLESHLPGVFRAMTVRASRAAPDDPDYGYIRIFTFNVPQAGPFVDEFVRLAALLPPDGLIIDVRGNGGGLIYAAEELLQVLTPRRIQPQPAQFVNTPANLRLCRRHGHSTTLPGLVLDPWTASIEQSVRTGATYSLGFPITPPAAANDRGQTYHGPVVLITDGLCYSATDMFAAGFQDHAIGTVVGVGGATGAGGANVWSHALLERLMEPDEDDPTPSPYRPLPRGADLRVAIRRTVRVGPNAGVVLEDLGVVPDVRYRMTRRDVMEGNADLVDTAIAELARQQPHVIVIDDVRHHRDRAPSVRVRTTNIDRVDAVVDGRRLHTHDVRRNGAVLELSEAAEREAGRSVDLEVLGYAGGQLVAVARDTITLD